MNVNRFIFGLGAKVLQKRFVSSLTLTKMDMNVLMPATTVKIPVCHYAKGKKDGKNKSNMTLADLEDYINAPKLVEQLKKATERITEDLQRDYGIRTNLSTFENVLVEFEDERHPLVDLAQVVKKNPSLVLINASSFPELAPNIMKALQNSGLNINPQLDGTTISIQTPKVTKEYRESMAKSVKGLLEKHLTVVRRIESEYSKKMELATSEKDVVFNGNLKIQELTSQTKDQMKQLIALKQKELLQQN